MEVIKKSYVVDEHNKKVAVQIDLETFEKIEQILEDHLFLKILMEREKDDVFMKVEEAKAHYNKLKKAKKSESLNRKKI